MQCKFCKQDVEKPCHNTMEVSERATSGISRCEAAKQNAQGLPAVDDEKGWENG